MNYFRLRHKILKDIRSGRVLARTPARQKRIHRCKHCQSVQSYEELVQNQFICKHCGGYYPMPAMERAEMILDEGYEILDYEVVLHNALQMKDYERKMKEAHIRTGLNESVIALKGTIETHPVYVLIMDPYFLMGSLGKNTGKIIAQTFEQAREEELPLILFAASGGARMQEGIFSLMQMANTVFSVLAHGEKNLFISVLTDPTMGGVPASFAGLGDITLVEKGARVGFSGPRVIEQTIGEILPQGFQRDEFLLTHGMVDDVIEREDFRLYLAKLLDYHRVYNDETEEELHCRHKPLTETDDEQWDFASGEERTGGSHGCNVSQL